MLESILVVLGMLFMVWIQHLFVGWRRDRNLPVTKNSKIPLYGGRMLSVRISDLGLEFESPIWGPRLIRQDSITRISARFIFNPCIVIDYVDDGRKKKEVVYTPVYRELAEYMNLLWKIQERSA